MKSMLMLVLLLLAGFPVRGAAQPGPFPPGPPRDGKGFKHGPGGPFEEVRSRLLREKLGLSEEKATAVEGLFNQGRLEHEKSMKSMRESQEKLQALLDADSGDQKAYQALLDEINATWNQLQGQREQEMRNLGAILTPKEQARLLLEMEKMHRRMKGPRGQGQGQGRNKGPGGPPQP